MSGTRFRLALDLSSISSACLSVTSFMQRLPIGSSWKFYQKSLASLSDSRNFLKIFWALRDRAFFRSLALAKLCALRLFFRVCSANTFRSYFRSSSRKISLFIWMAVAWNKHTEWQIDRVTDATGHQSIASLRSITRWCSLVHQTIWRRAFSSPIPVIIGSAANVCRHLNVCI